MVYSTNRAHTQGQGRLPALVAVGIMASLTLGAVLLACSESVVDACGGALSVVVTVDPPSQTVGQAVTVRSTANGTSLDGTIIDYGDGQVDSVGAFGACTQTVTQPKTYDSAGTYTVIATIEDLSQGSASDQVMVQINP